LQNQLRIRTSGSIYTKDSTKHGWLPGKSKPEFCYINAPTIGAEPTWPFGGVKGTGNGHREGGWTAFDIFTEWKTV
jgi:aldehyde dehydrogenase (NAD+)